MMSTTITRQQIIRFLASEAPEVMAIKGAWGVGKTYAWNAYLAAAKNQNRIALDKYSYVSLFGINSLGDLKNAIFENRVDRHLIGRKPSLESFKSNTAELLKSLGKKSLPLLPNHATSEHYRTMIDALAFLSLEKNLICFDDFERKGRRIEAQEILGLISQLKEQKRCKVVLILNDESLGEDSTSDYVTLREKVVDTEIRFAPTTEECVDIALHKGRVGSLLADNICRLKINNIRIIKKIETLAAVLVPLLKKYDDHILRQALRTLTLLTWCFYSRTGEGPEYSFVISRTSPFSDLEDDLSLSTQQQLWAALLRRYDNYAVDDFDLQIAELVENGYVDEKRIQEEAFLLQQKNLAARSEDFFQQAWRKFNDSFDDNTEEVVDHLANSFKHNARYISPINLDGSVRLLRQLGKSRLASRIINLYIEKRGDESELFSLDSSILPNQIKDPEVLEKFREKHESLRQKRTLQEVCAELLAGGSDTTHEEQQLAQADVQEYVEFFKSQKGPKLAEYVDFCLKFSRLGGTTEAQKQIADRAVAALQIIGRESQINASRVRRFGITLD